jgi:hypothetical protein
MPFIRKELSLQNATNNKPRAALLTNFLLLNKKLPLTEPISRSPKKNRL